MHAQPGNISPRYAAATNKHEMPGTRRGSRKDSPLPSWELLGSVQVQLSDFFGCLNYTIGILYVYQPFHSFALLLRLKNKRKVKKLCHTRRHVVSQLSKHTATHPKRRIPYFFLVFTTRQQNHLWAKVSTTSYPQPSLKSFCLCILLIKICKFSCWGQHTVK